ncbi:MAG TPA: hypothetical protein VFK05_14875 [Polyangiaceae bacterium]|nr:hypothetical protein [Polyangiaceae bacterium]
MQITALARRVLRLVFSLSSAGGALTRPRLERRLEASSAELNRALSELDRLGLLDAQRLRLTLPGLAVATALRARRVTKRRAVVAKPAPVGAPIALFSPREAPRAVA